MATAALQIDPEIISIGCYHTKVQELTELITCHSPRFHRIALAHLGDEADAEDAVQDALLSALTHVDQFRGQAKMSTWLTSIVINSARMKLRQRSSRLHLPWDQTNGQDFTLEETISDTRPDPERAYRNQEIADALARATSRLSPVLHRTFQLRDVYGLSIRETSHLMGVPSGTIKARLARARAKLKEAINESSQERLRQSIHIRDRKQSRKRPVSKLRT